MNALRDWYLGRSRREQVMLGVMLLVAVPVLVWLLVVMPVNGWHDEARDDYLAASERYGRVVLLAGAERDEGSGGRSIEQPLGDYVAASAAQAGFALTRNVPDGPARTDIGIAQARPQAALEWISQLRAAGIVVDRLQLADNGEGGVEVDLTLSKGGA